MNWTSNVMLVIVAMIGAMPGFLFYLVTAWVADKLVGGRGGDDGIPLAEAVPEEVDCVLAVS